MRAQPARPAVAVLFHPIVERRPVAQKVPHGDRLRRCSRDRPEPSVSCEAGANSFEWSQPTAQRRPEAVHDRPCAHLRPYRSATRCAPQPLGLQRTNASSECRCCACCSEQLQNGACIRVDYPVHAAGKARVHIHQTRWLHALVHALFRGMTCLRPSPACLPARLSAAQR